MNENYVSIDRYEVRAGMTVFVYDNEYSASEMAEIRVMLSKGNDFQDQIISCSVLYVIKRRLPPARFCIIIFSTGESRIAA